MINISNLVLAVKEKKEKEFQLFDKVKFICMTLGEKYHEHKVDSHLYKGDNLSFWLIQEDSSSKDPLQNVSIYNAQTDFLLFDYLYDISLGEGKTHKYIPGRWEKLVEQHYKMSLDNIE